MSLRYLIPFSAAALFHLALFLMVRLEEPALLSMSDEPESVEVDLVAAAPAAVQAEIVELPEPPQPEPVTVVEEPPPPPQPEPEPEVMEEPPPPPTPEPEAMTEPVPVEPPAPKPKPAPLKPKPTRSKPVSAAHTVSTSSANAGQLTGKTGGTAGNSNARPRFNPKPVYPALARKQKQEGTVMLSIAVGTDGRVTSVSISRSSGFVLLDQAAVNAAKRWRFEPARIGGIAVAGVVTRPVKFALTD